jgi:hypothetical protein
MGDRDGTALFPDRFLTTDGSAVFFRKDSSTVVDLTRDGQLAFAFVLDTEAIASEVREEIAKLRA